jgi:ABC-type amino acid transport substrate-binding protein
MDKRIAIFTILMLFVFSFIYSNDILNKSEREYIDNKGVIIFVGDTNYPPFYFVNKNNDIDGMTVELLRWIATELKLNIEFIHMPLSDGREAIQSGEADILCDFFYSINRDSTFDFTIPICDVPAYIYVKADRTDIKDINDLSGKIVSMQKGDYAYKFLQLKGIDFKILFTEDFSKAINLLINGESDAVIGDEQVIMYYVYSHNIYEKIKKIGYKLYDGKILSKGIILAQKTGTLDKIAEKWLGKTYEHHVNIFRKYLFISLIILSLILIVFLITWYTNLILRKNIKIRTKELEIQTTYFKGLFENSPEAIIIVDNMDRIIDINNAFKEMFGYKLKEIRNQFINNFIVPEDFKEEASNLSLESLNGNILVYRYKSKKTT